MHNMSNVFNVCHRDGLHPTYPPAMHYKWLVDLVMMPLGIRKMQYIVLAREDLTNQVEGRALKTKSTEAVCKFLLEDMVCRYGCIGKITADKGKLALTCAYNPEGNGKRKSKAIQKKGMTEILLNHRNT